MKINVDELKWIRAPKQYTITDEKIEIITEPFTDLWQRTYYHFRNDNAPVLQMATDEKYFSFVVKTEFDTKVRYDQSGIVMYLDSENWLKASIEYENSQIQRLGSVVTNNGYSDWSSVDIDASIKSVWFRLSRREDDFCIENSMDGKNFKQMRICHMFNATDTIKFGIYACSAEDSSFKATFTHLELTECKWLAHIGQKPDEEKLKPMTVREKILLDRKGLQQYGPINIVVLGDSISHGAVNGYMDYENVYWNLLKQKLNKYRDYMPVNIINAAIGGTTAKGALPRMEKQAFSHNPDLIIVCFGLNDVNGTLENYLDSLRLIFKRCIKATCETIFMTPNMLNTYVADDTPEQYREYAYKTAEMQNNGKVDEYIYAAVKLAEDMGISVCDCYSKWKKLSETEDITMLLANRINHPIPEMHKLFADDLYNIIIKNEQSEIKSDSTMFSDS